MRVPPWAILLCGCAVPAAAQGTRCPDWPEYGSARTFHAASSLRLKRSLDVPETRAVGHLVFASGGGYLVWTTEEGLHSVDLRRGRRTDRAVKVSGLGPGRGPGRVLAFIDDVVCSVDARDLELIPLRRVPARDGEDLQELRWHPELLLAWTRTPSALCELGGDDVPSLQSVLREYPAFWAASIAAREVVVHPRERWSAIAGNTYSWCGTCARNARFSVFAADGMELYRGNCSGTRSSVDMSPDGSALAWADRSSVTLVRTADWADVGEAKGCFCWWRFVDATTAIACDGRDLSLWYVPTLEVVERRALARAEPRLQRSWPRDFWAEQPKARDPWPRAFALSEERTKIAVQVAGELVVMRLSVR